MSYVDKDGKPLPCHNCLKPLGDNWEEVKTPICPVRVHKECKKVYVERMNFLLNAMAGRGDLL